MAAQPLLPSPPPRLSFEEFQGRFGDDKVEWVDQTTVDMSPVNRRHQEIGGFLYNLFSILLQETRAGSAFYDTFTLRMEDRARKPDLMVVLATESHRIHDTMVEGRADLVVEIISPESVGRDRGEKYVEYERAGVSEYWLIDPEREVAEFYQLRDGRYTLVPDDDGLYQSRVLPEVRVNVDWFWQSPPPRTLEVLRLWGKL